MPRRNFKVNGLDPADAMVGRKLRELRIINGMSQTKIGDAVGVTFQQIQKYERGDNRVSGARIKRLAELFGVPVTAFFEDVGAVNLDEHRETLELLRAYRRIGNPANRRLVRDLARNLAKGGA